MRKFKATFWRGNPQIKSGGYEKTEVFEARTAKSAERKAREYAKNCAYGWMELLNIEEVTNENTEKADKKSIRFI